MVPKSHHDCTTFLRQNLYSTSDGREHSRPVIRIRDDGNRLLGQFSSHGLILITDNHKHMVNSTTKKFSDDMLNASFETLVRSGDTDVGGVPCHFFRADEIRRLSECCGLETIEMAGCEGLSTGMIEATVRLGQDAEKWERWTDLIVKTSAEPAVVDMAEHMLYIGRTPGVD